MADERKEVLQEEMNAEEAVETEGTTEKPLHTFSDTSDASQDVSEGVEDTSSDALGDTLADAAEESGEGEESGDVPDDSGQDDKADKKLFKKKQKADKKQEAMKEKIEELEDRVKRQLAEFENFRKRTDKEKTAMFETGAKSVIEKILPVVDNFERGLASIPEEEKEKPFVEGIEMIYKQLMGELEKMEVKPIPAVGEEFNPEFHNAVMQVESEEFESGVVAQELQKGYTYRDSVVRHSMVAVVS